MSESLAIDFANTLTLSRGTVVEGLADTEDVVVWATEHLHRDLTGPVELTPFLGLRDAVRGIASSISDGEVLRPEDVATLNAAAAAAPIWPVLDGAAVREETQAGPAAAALAAIARSAIELFGGPHRTQVQICGRYPACIRFFLKTHPRRDYCSPACGNRARVSRHYDRHHHASAVTGP